MESVQRSRFNAIGVMFLVGVVVVGALAGWALIEAWARLF